MVGKGVGESAGIQWQLPELMSVSCSLVVILMMAVIEVKWNVELGFSRSVCHVKRVVMESD